MTEFLHTSTVQMLILTGIIGGKEVIDPGVAPAIPTLTSLEQLKQTCNELGKRVSFAEHHVGIEIMENYFPSNALDVDHSDDCASITMKNERGTSGVEGSVDESSTDEL